MSLLKIKLDELNTRNLQTRAALNEDTVADYAEAMERGDKFPAVTVFTDGAEYYLADGFHRVEALRRIGKKAVVAELREGDYKAALLHALKANSTHGLRRTNADKRHALEMAWNAREALFGGEPSQNLLADTCGISRKTVERFMTDKVATMSQPVKKENAQNGENETKTAILPKAPPTRKMTGKLPPQRPVPAPVQTPAPVRPATPTTPPARRVGRDGKTYTVKSYLGGYGNFEYSAKLSGLKVTSAYPGYKKATFTVTFKPKKALTEAQGQKVLKAFKRAYYYQGGASGNEREVVWSYWMRGALSFWLVDYKTGRLLVGSDNAAGIERDTKVSYDTAREYATRDGKWSMTQFRYIKMRETVTFPEDYEGMCVGIGGETQPRIMRTKRDENFEGRYFKYVGAKMHTARWWQTSYFKKANDNFHFMRIR